MSDDFQNKNIQNLNQNNPQNQKVKLRLRLKSGEEFEAEGSLPFVLAQKNEFLTKAAPKQWQSVAPQQNTQYTQSNAEILPTPPNTNINDEHPNPESTLQETLPPQDEQFNEQFNEQLQPAKNITTHRIVNPAEYNLHIPAIRRRQNQNNSQQEMLPLNIEDDRNIPLPAAASGTTHNTTEQTSTLWKPEGNSWQIDEKIWSKIAYLDGMDLVLRRKVKDLKPNLAALITLAAAKMLGGITKMSALELSKSLRMSGYIKGGERLDRVLAAEIKAGTVFFEGSKRKREYIISQTGTAKAYTAAEHFFIAQ